MSLYAPQDMGSYVWMVLDICDQTAGYCCFAQLFSCSAVLGISSLHLCAHLRGFFKRVVTYSQEILNGSPVRIKAVLVFQPDEDNRRAVRVG